jgi:transposase-like protein
VAPVSTGHLSLGREAWGYPQAQAYVGRLPEDRNHYRRARRRRWTTEEKLRIVDETLRSGESVSVLARRNGVAPNLLYRWRRLMTEGGAVAVQADDAVTGNTELRRLEERMRELERQLGRKTLEGGAGPVAGKKTDVARDVAAQGRFPVKAVAEALGVSRSNLAERLAGGAKPRRRYQKAQDAAILPLVRRLVDARPTYGYRRITALLNRDLAEQGLAPANQKRVYRLMKVHGLLLEKHSGQRPGRQSSAHSPPRDPGSAQIGITFRVRMDFHYPPKPGLAARGVRGPAIARRCPASAAAGG